MNAFKISVLGSTRGSNLPGLSHGLLNTPIKMVSVVSNQLNSGILEKAQYLNLPHFYFEPDNFENSLHEHLMTHKIDLLVLMGFMKILSAEFISQWKNKIINIHPSLLPKYAGLMNLQVHQAVLDAKEKQTGCTVHWVTEQVDAGGIILQKRCDVFSKDTADTLKERVQPMEVQALIEAITKISAIKPRLKRALISVSDKTGLIPFAKKLAAHAIDIISTGGTAKALQAENIPVTLVSDVTQFPEIMSGRVKTLHPKIHGAILGKRDEHHCDAEKHDIFWIDYVVCNLYPFSETVNEGHSFSECIEQIDIGGPTLIRAAAKNSEWVTVINDPCDYDSVMTAIDNNQLDLTFRKKLAAKAFAHTAQYDAMIAHYLNTDDMPSQLTIPFKKIMDCRYGENPHQSAAAYRNLLENTPSILDATLLQGKPLSYNNLNDASAALNTLIVYQKPTCVIVKHANPCGVALAENIDHAFEKAWNADSQSAFGGIVALNKPCTKKIAEFLISVFIEVIIAPAFSEAALTLFSKKPNIRVLLQQPWPTECPTHAPKWISGGLLWQTVDDSVCDQRNFHTVTQAKPSESHIAAMQFAWPVLKQLKSNAILISASDVTLGMGMGQVSRVDAVECAIKKAGKQLENAILASDAFFPFTDNIELIAKTSIKAIVQPGGSIKDEAVIAACDKYGIAMVFTGQRCFNH